LRPTSPASLLPFNQASPSKMGLPVRSSSRLPINVTLSLSKTAFVSPPPPLSLPTSLSLSRSRSLSLSLAVSLSLLPLSSLSLALPPSLARSLLFRSLYAPTHAKMQRLTHTHGPDATDTHILTDTARRDGVAVAMRPSCKGSTRTQPGEAAPRGLGIFDSPQARLRRAR
jgi:hypothetical protein